MISLLKSAAGGGDHVVKIAINSSNFILHFILANISLYLVRTILLKTNKPSEMQQKFQKELETFLFIQRKQKKAKEHFVEFLLEPYTE